MATRRRYALHRPIVDDLGGARPAVRPEKRATSETAAVDRPPLRSATHCALPVIGSVGVARLSGRPIWVRSQERAS